MILLQILGFQIFDYNHVIVPDQVSCQLMKVVSALIGNPFLAAGFIDPCTLPVGIIIKLFQMVRAVMIPLPHLALSKVTTSGILTLPPNGLFFQPFCVKSAVLDTIRTNHQIGEAHIQSDRLTSLRQLINLSFNLQ